VDLATAAALPEVAATVWSNLMMVAGLRAGDNLLVHGGAGGIGTFAIQLGHALGARVLTTGGTPEKLAFCASLGADVTIDYREQDFVEAVRDATDGRGVDVVLDNMGASYLARNIEVLADGGRLVVIGLQGGHKAELDLNALMRKRGAVIATALRGRPVRAKTTICAAVVEHVWPLVADGTIRPVIERTVPLAEAATAHALMESGSHTGKIVLVSDL
jgi:NADPH:quinone reductase-like Zn-dependent oxidoreductase